MTKSPCGAMQRESVRDLINIGPIMNAHYQTGLPDDVVSTLDAMAKAEAWSWLNVYKFALWLGLVAVEDKGGLRNAEAALGSLLPETAGGWRSVKVPRDARDLVDIAKREGVQ